METVAALGDGEIMLRIVIKQVCIMIEIKK